MSGLSQKKIYGSQVLQTTFFVCLLPFRVATSAIVPISRFILLRAVNRLLKQVGRTIQQSTGKHNRDKEATNYCQLE